MTEEIKLYFPFLEEIRKRLLLVISVFIITSILGFVYYEKIIYFFLGLIKFSGINIVFTSPFQFVNLAISSGILVGVVCSFPLLIFQILSFLKPALKPNEFKTIIYLLPLVFLLFIGGFIFGFLIMKYVITLFYQKSQELNIDNILDISNLISQVLFTSLLLGIFFQYPIIITLLLRLKVITINALANQRPFIYSAALVIAALLPPTDILSLILLTLPLVILFEITLLLNKLIFKPKN